LKRKKEVVTVTLTCGMKIIEAGKEEVGRKDHEGNAPVVSDNKQNATGEK